MKLFRVVAKDGREWWGVTVLARNELEAACDPCLGLNSDEGDSHSDGTPPYRATEITYASLRDVEQAHHCPRFVWQYNDNVSQNREVRERYYKLRYNRRPIAQLRMPEIVGLVYTPKGKLALKAAAARQRPIEKEAC